VGAILWRRPENLITVFVVERRNPHLESHRTRRPPRPPINCFRWSMRSCAKLAASKMARELPNQTLQATALVHEAWMRPGWKRQSSILPNRAHFFAAAPRPCAASLLTRPAANAPNGTEAAWKRWHGDAVELSSPPKRRTNFLPVHEALDKLPPSTPSRLRLVKLRYFVGMTNIETAQALGPLRAHRQELLEPCPRLAVP